MFPAASNATLLACSVETPVMVFFNDPSGLCHSTRPSLENDTRTSPALGVGPALNVTLLSVLVDAVLPLPAASVATPAPIVAVTVPEVVMPLTATVDRKSVVQGERGVVPAGGTLNVKAVSV